jgi:hypothetical protein
VNGTFKNKAVSKARSILVPPKAIADDVMSS